MVISSLLAIAASILVVLVIAVVIRGGSDLKMRVDAIVDLMHGIPPAVWGISMISLGLAACYFGSKFDYKELEAGGAAVWGAGINTIVGVTRNPSAGTPKPPA